MSENKRPTRKRSRSEKGCAYDEMLETKSPKAKDMKKTDKSVKKKVQRKIVFTSDSEENDNVQVNNNANINVKKTAVGRTNKSSKSTAGKARTVVIGQNRQNRRDLSAKPMEMLDPCFKN